MTGPMSPGPNHPALGDHVGVTFYAGIGYPTSANGLRHECEIHGLEPDIAADPKGYDEWYDRHGQGEYGMFCLDQPMPDLYCADADCSEAEHPWPCPFAQGVIAGLTYKAQP